MSEIKFEKQVKFIGRGGAFKCIGLEIKNIQGVISIEPVTSNGNTDKCMVEIPQESINDVVNAITGKKSKKTNSTDVKEELKQILALIKENSLEAWEDNLEETKSVVVLEDFSKHSEYSGLSEEAMATTYNGWYERLKKLAKSLK